MSAHQAIPHNRRLSSRDARQLGFTLVELMVAMVLGLLVAAAAVATLIIGRQGFTSVDSSTQLRETARFAASAIEQAANQAGFVDAAYGLYTATTPGIRGYTNSLVSPALASLPNGLAHNTRNSSNCGSATGTACLGNGSDVLMVQFRGSSVDQPSLTIPDQSVIDCAGMGESEVPANGPGPGAYSIISVATGSAGETNAEPSLACTYYDQTGLAFKTVPIIQGVESFRLLYGTYGVSPGVCSSVPSSTDIPPDSYLTAAQLDGPGGTYCANNWARVQTIRVGLLVRGPVGSAEIPQAVTWSMMGTNFTAAADAWKTVQTAADGRLRQQLVFTIHIRNPQ